MKKVVVYFTIVAIVAAIAFLVSGSVTFASFENYNITDSVKLSLFVKDNDLGRDADSVVAKIYYNYTRVRRIKLFELGNGEYEKNIDPPDTFGTFKVKYIVYGNWIADSAEVEDMFRTDSLQVLASIAYGMLTNGTYGLSALKNYVDVLPVSLPSSWDNTYMNDLRDSIRSLNLRITAARAEKLDSITVGKWNPAYLAPFAALIADSILNNANPADTVGLWLKVLAGIVRDSVAKDSVAFQGSAAGLTAKEVADSVFGRRINPYSTNDSTFGYVARITKDSILRIVRDTLYTISRQLRDSIDMKLSDIGGGGGGGLSGAEHDTLYALISRQRAVMAALGMGNVKVIYVDDNGSNASGNDWGQARTTIRQAVIDATPAAESYIFVAPGTYSATRASVTANNCRIIGAGDQTVIVGSPDSTGIFNAGTAVGFSIQNCAIQLNGVKLYGITTSDAFLMRGCKVTGDITPSVGLAIVVLSESGDRSMIEDNTFNVGTAYHVIFSSSANPTIRRNRFLGGYTVGIFYDGTDVSAIYDNAFAGPGTVVQFSSTSDSNIVFNNWVSTDSPNLFINAGSQNEFVNNMKVSEFSDEFTLQEDLKWVKDSARASVSSENIGQIAAASKDSVWRAQQSLYDSVTGSFGSLVDTMTSAAGMSGAQQDSLFKLLDRQKKMLAMMGAYNTMFYYVDSSTGSDGNTGLSWSSAKATISNAVASVSGATDYMIFVGEGTYDGEVVSISSKNLQIVGSGIGKTFVRGADANASVFTISDGANSAKIKDMTIFADSVNTACIVVGADGVEISECEFYGYADAASVKRPLISVLAGSDRTVIKNNRIEAEGSSAILIAADAKYSLIWDNIISGSFTQYVLDVTDASYSVISGNVLNNFGGAGVVLRSGSDTTLFVSNKVGWSSGASVDNLTGGHSTLSLLDNSESYESFLDDPTVDGFSKERFLTWLNSRTDSLKDSVDTYARKNWTLVDSLRDSSLIMLGRLDARTDSLKDTVDAFASKTFALVDSVRDSVNYYGDKTHRLLDSLRDSSLIMLGRIDARTDSLKDTLDYYAFKSWVLTDSTKDTVAAALSMILAQADSVGDLVRLYLPALDSRTDSMKDTIDYFSRRMWVLTDSTRDTVNAILSYLRTLGDTVGLVYADMYGHGDTVLIDFGDLVNQIWNEDSTGHTGNSNVYGYLTIQAAVGGFGVADRESLRVVAERTAQINARTDSLKDTLDYFGYKTWKLVDTLRDSSLIMLAKIDARTDSLKDTLDYYSKQSWALLDSVRDSVNYYGARIFGLQGDMEDSVNFYLNRIYVLADSTRDSVNNYLADIFGVTEMSQDSIDYYLSRLYVKAGETEDSVRFYGYRGYWISDSLRDTTFARLWSIDARTDSLKDTLDYYLFRNYALADSVRDSVNYYFSRIYSLEDSIRDTVNTYLDQVVSAGYEEGDKVSVYWDSTGWYVWTFDSTHFASNQMGRFNIDGGLGTGSGGDGSFLQTDRDTLFELIRQVRGIRDSLSQIDSVYLFDTMVGALADRMKDSLLLTQDIPTAYWMKWLAGITKDSVGSVGTVAAHEIALEVWNIQQSIFRDSTGTMGQRLDTLMSAILGVTGFAGLDITVIDSATMLPIYNASVMVANHEDSRVISGGRTNGSGTASFLFGANDTLQVRVGAFGYSFYDVPKQSITVAGISRDTIFGHLYSPVSPLDTALCTTWGQILNASGQGEYRARISATIESKLTVKFGPILLNKWTVVDTTNTDGLWELSVFKGRYLTPLNSQVTFQAVDSLGRSIANPMSIIVPDSTTYRVRWK